MDVKIFFDADYVECDGFEDAVDKNFDLFRSGLDEVMETISCFIKKGIFPRIGESIFVNVSDGIFTITDIIYHPNDGISFYFQLQEWSGEDYRAK